MKVTNVVQSAIDTVHSEEAQEMGIDTASSVFLMDALGKLYSKPARAALREYLANAIDAHIEAGGELPPVEVGLPLYNGTLSIRDYGNGLSEDGFNNIISRYGASTKRDSNKVHGGFGLGAKAGFAVSDEFFMTGYQKGKLVKVRIFKNENRKGFVEVLKRENTTEPDGVLVEVPIARANIPELTIDSLKKDRFFDAYTDKEIHVFQSKLNRNASGYSPEYSYDTLSCDESSIFGDSFFPLEFGGETLGWAKKEISSTFSYDKVRAVIGRVSYEIGMDSSKENALDRLYESGWDVVLNLPIGSVDLPSSREEITYSERSRNTIVAVAESVLRMLEEKTQRELNAIDSRFDALYEVVKLRENKVSGLDKMLWRGESLPVALNSSLNGNVKFDTKGDSALVFVKSEKGRPSLTKKLLDGDFAFPQLVAINEENANRALTIVVPDEAAFMEAEKRVNAGITDYRKSLGMEKGKLTILLFRSDEQTAKWFNFGKSMTLPEFKEAVRTYRANLRKTLTLASESDEVSQEPKLIAPSRRVQWIGLDDDSLAADSFSTGDMGKLVASGSKVYYLSADELKNTHYDVSARFKEMLKSPASYSIGNADRERFKLLRSVLGADAKLVFLAQSRNTSTFVSKYPLAESILPVLRQGVHDKWELMKETGEDSDYIFSQEFGRMKKSNRGSAITHLITVLSEEEKATIDPLMLEINRLLDSDTRSKSYSNILIHFLDETERREVVKWIENKVDIVAERYPLLTNLSAYEMHEWRRMKNHLYEYVQSH